MRAASKESRRLPDVLPSQARMSEGSRDLVFGGFEGFRVEGLRIKDVGAWGVSA